MNSCCQTYFPNAIPQKFAACVQSLLLILPVIKIFRSFSQELETNPLSRKWGKRRSLFAFGTQHKTHVALKVRGTPMKKEKITDSRLLTRAEVAGIFQVAPSTITRWAEAGKLPTVKTLGGHRRYAAEVVLELAHYLTQEETRMEKTLISVPAMYGDHHVLEVRRILLELPGVVEVNASSCFQAVEVSFDPAKLSVAQIEARLDEAGYLGELPVPVETGTAVSQEPQAGERTFFRHTAAYEQTKQVVSFTQDIPSDGRPLWPCPGLGVIARKTIRM